MGKVIEISDEQYRTIERAAATRGQSPDALLTWVVDQAIDELRDSEPVYVSKGFRGSGASSYS